MKIHKVPISSLTSDPRNARQHGQRNLAVLRSSLTRFGQRRPVVVVKSTRRVIAGNGLLRAATDLGWESIEAIFVEDNESEAKAFALVDNRSAELSLWDDVELGEQLAELRGGDWPVEDLGWSRADYDALCKSEEDPLPPEDDMDMPDRDKPIMVKLAIPAEVWTVKKDEIDKALSRFCKVFSSTKTVKA